MPEEDDLTDQDVADMFKKAIKDFGYFEQYVRYGNNSKFGNAGILKGSTSSGNAIVQGFGLTQVNRSGDSFIVPELLVRLGMVEYCGSFSQKALAAYYAYRLGGLLDKALGDTYKQYRDGTNLTSFREEIAEIREATPSIGMLVKSPYVAFVSAIKDLKSSESNDQAGLEHKVQVKEPVVPAEHKSFVTQLREKRDATYALKKTEVGPRGGWRNPANAREPLFALSEEQNWGRYGAFASALVIGEIGEVLLGGNTEEQSPYDLSTARELIEKGLGYVFGNASSDDGNTYKFVTTYTKPAERGGERLKIDFYSVAGDGSTRPMAGIRIKPKRGTDAEVVGAVVTPVVPKGNHFTSDNTGLDSEHFALGQGDALIHFATASLVKRILDVLPRSVDGRQRAQLQHLRKDRAGDDGFTKFIPRA